MTTTAAQHRTRRGVSAGARVLWGAALVALLVGVVLVPVAGAVSGPAAASGALVGVALLLAVMGLGTSVVHAVAGLLPRLSVVVSLLTYGLEVVVLGAVLVALTRSGLLDTTVDRGWLAIGLATGAVAWTLTQVRLAATARIPVYDLPAPASPAPVRGDRS